jgi:hypothetical protein
MGTASALAFFGALAGSQLPSLREREAASGRAPT